MNHDPRLSKTKLTKILTASAICFFSIGFSHAQNAGLQIQADDTSFNASSRPGTPTTLWFNLHVELNGQLNADGDSLLFSGGTLSFSGIGTSFGSSVSLPKGEIIADHAVLVPTTSFNSSSNTYVTKVPLSYKSSDLFISGDAITSTTGFALTGGYKATSLAGYFSSNKQSFTSAWFYGLTCYQPAFTNSNVGPINSASGIPFGNNPAGTPVNQMAGLVQGGSDHGGATHPFTITSATSFPVSLASFTAELNDNNNTALLDWVTTSVADASYFVIQRSDDGTSYNDVAIVLTEENNGAAERAYNYSDHVNGATASLIYYRLKMVGTQGQYSYSEIEVIRTEKTQPQTKMSAYPNPAVSEIKITVPDTWQNKTVSFSIYNIEGIAVKTVTCQNASQTETVNIGGLKAGTYFVKVTNGKDQAAQKIIKIN
ncbi:MAG TPA: T9SS type A sorting domain-containing protein [Puia sp.]|nr:T9SS type A sorting domain-containing protein [Puia sp.]